MQTGSCFVSSPDSVYWGVARLLDRDRPEDAAKLRVAMHVFRELRGLEVDVDTEDHKQISIRFV